MPTILLVEDDAALSAGLTYTLEEEYAVLHARTAEQAREAFQNGSFDLVLLDVALPDGNGYDLCRELRARSDKPVIFLTACDDEASIVRGLDMGGDDYVTKPFRLKELMSRVKAQLRRGTASASAVLTAGNLKIIPQQSRAEVAGKELSLTMTEYRLLSVFCLHLGQTLTRASLLDKLWDNRGEFIDDNTLSVHVRHLREKMNDAGCTAEIITARGIGYRLEA